MERPWRTDRQLINDESVQQNIHLGKLFIKIELDELPQEGKWDTVQLMDPTCYNITVLTWTGGSLRSVSLKIV